MSTTPQPSPGAKMPPVEIASDLAVEYANLVRIAHTPSELVFDFAHLLPGGRPAHVSSRIVMSPMAAKLFHRALTENLSKYETVFGTIDVPGDTSLANQLFRSGPPSNQEPPETKPD